MSDPKPLGTSSVVAIAIAASALTSSAVTAAFLKWPAPSAASSPSPVSIPSVETRTEAVPGDATVSVVRASQPAVVAIAVTAEVSRQALTVDPWGFGRTRSRASVVPAPAVRRQVSSGSGFFVSEDGLLVTNRHVISLLEGEGAKPEFEIVGVDGARYVAKLVATDPLLDLALLKAEMPTGTKSVPLAFADQEPEIGQSVIAVGNALDEFRNSVTKGVVSGLNRRIVASSGEDDEEVIEGAIQTDAAINPGNSGGPLLDLRGKVVGVNTAVSEDAQGLGFAIPSSAVRQAVESYRAQGRIVRPYLGIRYVSLDAEIAKEHRLSVTDGALVVPGATKADPGVVAGSPAARAGLREGDVVREVDGEKVDESHSLAARLARHAVGDTVKLSVLRGTETLTVSVTLEEFKSP